MMFCVPVMSDESITILDVESFFRSPPPANHIVMNNTPNAQMKRNTRMRTARYRLMQFVCNTY